MSLNIDPVGSKISEFDDPQGLLEGNPALRRRELPEGLRLEVLAADRWLPCWLQEERRIRRQGELTRSGMIHRVVTAVSYRLVVRLYCVVGEIGSGARLRLTTSLPRESGKLNDGGWALTLGLWGYQSVEVLEAGGKPAAASPRRQAGGGA